MSPSATLTHRQPAGTEPVRTLALWFPDWPITALARSGTANHVTVDLEEPVAIVRAHTIVACSAAARAQGVRVGGRRRDAQAACPSLRLVTDDQERDMRAFLPLLKHVEELVPGAQPVRPGLCLLRARGPARYYGSEEKAAQVLLNRLTDLEVPATRAGVADGPFTAEQAARSARTPVTIVPPGSAAEFLAPLSVTTLDDPALADFLARLGVHTLGQFASLEETRVRARLSEHGVRLHALASGSDSRPIVPRIPPPELAREIAFEPPLELAEQVAFAIRTTADAVLTALAAASLACTEVRIELFDDRGGHDERVWLHPTCFDASDIVDRVRWQLQAVWEGADPALASGVALVRITPEAVDAASAHQPGLFGQGTDARLHHALSRVQGLLGHGSVVLASVGGGRKLREREVRVAWGDRLVQTKNPDQPWPGTLPDPLPATIFADRFPVVVIADDGSEVRVNDRGMLTAKPAALGVRGRLKQLTSWAGPWPLQERSWDDENRSTAFRFQVVTDDQSAWLLLLDERGWIAEGRYD